MPDDFARVQTTDDAHARSGVPVYTDRLKALVKHWRGRMKLYEELYENGGKHQKDIDCARLLESVIQHVCVLFPELELTDWEM